MDLKRTGSCPGPLVVSAYIYIGTIPHTVHAAMEPTGVQLSGKCCEQPCGPKKDRIMSRTLGSVSLHIHRDHPSHCAHKAVGLPVGVIWEERRGSFSP